VRSTRGFRRFGAEPPAGVASFIREFIIIILRISRRCAHLKPIGFK
jgi:hypothetical protein